jgi:FMN-dependent NADH-azoreductase
MSTILVVTSSPRGDESASNKLSQTIVDKLSEKHPGSKVVRRDLTVSPLPHLDPVTLEAFFNKPETHTDHHKRAVTHSDAAIAELLAADCIVIASPMWNFSIPSVLKAWIDHLARAGKTFKYTATGPVGLVQNKKVYLALATGGIYSSGPAKPLDFLEPYLRAVLGFMGMTEVQAWRAEGVAMSGNASAALAKAQAAVQV